MQARTLTCRWQSRVATTAVNDPLFACRTEFTAAMLPAGITVFAASDFKSGLVFGSTAILILPFKFCLAFRVSRMRAGHCDQLVRTSINPLMSVRSRLWYERRRLRN
jgi:hypothetical protein